MTAPEPKILWRSHSPTICSELSTSVQLPSVYKTIVGELELSRDEVDLPAWNVANEVIDGFAVEKFSAAVAPSPDAFKQLAGR